MFLPGVTHRSECIRRYRVSGISLIEMLAAIGVFSVLAVLMIPTIGKMRSTALAGKCTSQLKNAGVAFHRYISDMNGRIMTRRGGDRGGSVDMWGAELSGRGYLTEQARKDGHRSYTGTDPAILTCPGIRSRPANYTMENWAWFTYGLNLFTPGVKSTTELGTPLSVRSVLSIEEPSKFILLADAVSANGYPSFRIRLGDGGLALAHSDRGNALYLDGHIQPLTREEGKNAGIPEIYQVKD